MKHKKTKITAGILIFLVLVVAVVAIGISPFAKSYIEKHSKELIGRQVRLKDLRMNIFTGVLEIDSIRMYEKDDQTLFASIDSFSTDITLSALLGKRIEIEKLKVVRPYTEIIQKGSTFNFDDLLPKPDSTAVKSPSDFPKSITINHILIHDGVLIYTDKLLNHTIQLNDLAITIPRLAFETGNTDVGIHLKIGKDAILENKFTMNMANNEYLWDLKGRNLPIGMIKPYLKESFNIGQLEGSVNGQITIKGNTNHILDFSITGKADAHDFLVTNASNEEVVSIKQTHIGIHKIHLPSATYQFDSISAKGMNLTYILRPNGDNVNALFKPEPAKAVESDVPMPNPTMTIEHLKISESHLSYTDQTIKQPFRLALSDLSFRSEHFNINQSNRIQLAALFPRGGKANIEWEGNLNQLSHQKLRAEFHNINLETFSPYCYEYTAHDITKGNMNFTTKYLIQNNFINSSNTIDVYKMSVSKKHKGIDAPYSNVPLRLGVYILKDKDDKIQFDIPVKGDLNNPEFSYKKIIFKTIGNLIVKVAVSPIRFLANSFGLNPDQMESIAIEPLQKEITAEQYSLMNDLAEIYKKKPEMSLSLTQYLDQEEAIEELKLYLAKESYIKSLQPLENNNTVTAEEVYSIKDKEPAFIAYIDTLFAKRADLQSATPLTEKDKLDRLYPIDSTRELLHQLISERNRMFYNYLMTTCGIPKEKLKVETASEEKLKDYDKKSKYAIEMGLGDENSDSKTQTADSESK